MLAHKNVPFYYHPGTVILVDDQSTYLRSMITAVDYAADCLGFHDPQEALKFLQDKAFEPLVLGNGMQGDNVIKPAHLEAYLDNDQRFKVVTTVVVDYNMPSMTGLDFCRELKSPHIRKIMLTGDANSDLAVQAFNEGIIDKFFKKSSEQAVRDLNEAVLNAQFNYYIEQTETFIKTVQKKYLPSFLQNQALIKLLLDFIKNNKCCEFYFLNYEGDILLVDRAGSLQLLMVRGEAEMQNVAQIVEQTYLDEPIENLKNMVADFKNKKLIAAPTSSAQKNANLAAWQKRVLPVKILTSSEGNVYYSLIDAASVDLSNYLHKSMKVKGLDSFEGLFEVR